MSLPGEWVDSCSPQDTSNAPPQPDGSNNIQRPNVNIVPRAYHPSERLSLEFWDHRRLAEHASALMPLDCASAAVDFILRDNITGSFLFRYTNQIDEIILGDKDKCELTRKIARIVPFWIPWRRERFTSESYSLPKLVEDLNAKFDLCDTSLLTSLVATEEAEDLEDETPSPFTLPSNSDSERPDPDSAKESEHHLSLVEHCGQAQFETHFPLDVTLLQSSLSQDIFTSPTLLEMGFQHDFPAAPAFSMPSVQMPAARVAGRSTPIRSSGPEAPGDSERTGHRPKGGQRNRRMSAVVAPGCPLLCFGVLLDLSRRLLIPRALAFSPRQLITNIEETRPNQAELDQSHVS
ncbi:hypothetical protein H4582DRAFT_2075334 [Lactarius indigo]|nr:hypothetical protein H4582DRAFT_2075334 [Lactarius indigo]